MLQLFFFLFSILVYYYLWEVLVMPHVLERKIAFSMLTSLLLLSILSFCFGISWKMAKTHLVPRLSDLTSKRLCFCNALLAAALFSGLFFIGSVFTTTDYIERISRWQLKVDPVITPADRCKAECRPKGSEALPKGLVRTTSNLDMRPLWGFPKANPKESKNLLAIPVGIKQKESVNQIIKKFLPSGFVVMLFHYDGEVDAWRDLPWSKSVVHVSAASQTKWWFAKRFLHPDVVTEYEYIFLWDEDLGVEHFDPRRYISIVKEEGLEISQPALGPHSETHHQITERVNNTKVHRKTNKSRGNKKCYENSTAPPCVGWVEMMAPVFTRAAWRCTWYMIQNDLIHAWGLDYNLGYCAQGNRSKNVGVVDSEYVFHEGVATLGGAEKKGVPENSTARWAVRRHSSVELEEFKRRWRKAAKEDECWTDPYS
ncbi:hypothetical protein CKAN_00289100 [Cinnamomum micranthum f. kanehirae]|uniref:DUF707 domain-containing protein n=1 Tax=Cinnamomum micranthum f. kanehirae TaxID=337451 RepID=A0A3S3MDR7_9MAGN|nr:hypothetical protein CKAN_00289100 [Cinnamomum micranthum f. kanehirae]